MRRAAYRLVNSGITIQKTSSCSSRICISVPLSKEAAAIKHLEPREAEALQGNDRTAAVGCRDPLLVWQNLVSPMRGDMVAHGEKVRFGRKAGGFPRK